MYMSEGKNKKMNVKQISERLNKENVKKGFEYIRRNGVSRFWTLAKAKAFPAGNNVPLLLPAIRYKGFHSGYDNQSLCEFLF